MINAIANPTMPEKGERYLGTVVKIMPFGAFVSLLPGKDGLLHISKLRQLNGGQRVENVEDVVSVGQKLQVEISEIDEKRQAVADPGGRGEGSRAPVREPEQSRPGSPSRRPAFVRGAGLVRGRSSHQAGLPRCPGPLRRRRRRDVGAQGRVRDAGAHECGRPATGSAWMGAQRRKGARVVRMPPRLRCSGPGDGWVPRCARLSRPLPTWSWWQPWMPVTTAAPLSRTQRWSSTSQRRTP